MNVLCVCTARSETTGQVFDLETKTYNDVVTVKVSLSCKGTMKCRIEFFDLSMEEAKGFEVGKEYVVDLAAVKAKAA